MTTVQGVGAGALITPGRVACGAAVVAWLFLARHTRALERQVNAIARKAELARGNADRRFQALEAKAAALAAVAEEASLTATAVADVADLQQIRDAVREMIQQAEDASRAYTLDTTPPE